VGYWQIDDADKTPGRQWDAGKLYVYYERMKIHANERKQALLQQRDALSAAFRSLAGTRERVQARSSLWTFGRGSFPKDLRDSLVRLSMMARVRARLFASLLSGPVDSRNNNSQQASVRVSLSLPPPLSLSLSFPLVLAGNYSLTFGVPSSLRRGCGACSCIEMHYRPNLM